jgi:hypothetical protein
MEILKTSLDSRRLSGTAPPRPAPCGPDAAYRARFVLLFVAWAGAWIFAAPAQAQVDEYRLKAAFLLNFAKFVEWPEQSFKAPTDPVVICILGANPFGNALSETINGKVAGGRALTVRPISDAQAACACSILFVTASEARKFRTIVPSLKGSGVLTVGETDSFTAQGGVVNFKLDRGKIQLEVNVEAAEYVQVHISSKLLSLAQIVRRAP